MESFLAEVWNRDWVLQHDAGRPFAETVAELSARHPERAALIHAFQERWPETVSGAIEGSVVLLDALQRRGIPLYALSNFSAETFPYARERFAFLAWFDGIVISGDLGVTKPDARIYRSLLERYDITPSNALFIDDVAANVEAAREVGMQGLHFAGADSLREELQRLDLL